jgi:hypothetical protein
MSVNAIERLWRAREEGDWDAVAALVRPGVRISLPHQGREPSREEYLSLLHFVHNPDNKTSVRRVITGRGLDIAVHAQVQRSDTTLVCAGFYELQEGLIERIDEFWLVPGGERFPSRGVDS